ncbi:MAG TPA: hypothetical protein VEW42_01935 [Candidatus Eisenbacteria bacterium]|nr:hypothetical protein [Candidatus Eisenbacteria bacterium]
MAGTPKECGAASLASKGNGQFDIDLMCTVPPDQCPLKQVGFIPKKTSKSYGDISARMGGTLSPQQIESAADALIPVVEGSATSAASKMCAIERASRRP